MSINHNTLRTFLKQATKELLIANEMLAAKPVEMYLL